MMYAQLLGPHGLSMARIAGAKKYQGSGLVWLLPNTYGFRLCTDGLYNLGVQAIGATEDAVHPLPGLTYLLQDGELDLALQLLLGATLAEQLVLHVANMCIDMVCAHTAFYAYMQLRCYI